MGLIIPRDCHEMWDMIEQHQSEQVTVTRKLGGLVFLRKQKLVPYYTQWLQTGEHPLAPAEKPEDRVYREKLAAAVDSLVRTYRFYFKVGSNSCITLYYPKLRKAHFSKNVIARAGLLSLSSSAYLVEQEFWRIANEAAIEARRMKAYTDCLAREEAQRARDEYLEGLQLLFNTCPINDVVARRPVKRGDHDWFEEDGETPYFKRDPVTGNVIVKPLF